MSGPSLEACLGSSLGPSLRTSRFEHRNPVKRPYEPNNLKYSSNKRQMSLRTVGGLVPGIAPSRYTTARTDPGYTSAPHSGHGGTGVRCTVSDGGVNSVVGL